MEQGKMIMSTLQVHLCLYSSSKALGLVMDLERCLERPIGLGVNIVASEVVGAKAAPSALGRTSPRGRTPPCTGAGRNVGGGAGWRAS